MEIGKLTTHVLDTTHGCPASGIEIELWHLPSPTVSDSSQTLLLKKVIANADGRTDEPLLQESSFVPGTYELRFSLGAYFQRRSTPLSDPPFLDIVPIRFSIADATSHYHVPLLCSPWSYSTYRGS